MEGRFCVVSFVGVPFAIALSVCLSSSNGTPADGGGPIDGATGIDLDAGAPNDSAAPVDSGTGVGDGAAPCTPSGAPIMHTADIAADETWASGVHVVPASITITSGARLTIAACSEVQLGVGASITASATAAGIDAVGTADASIRFVPAQTGSAWGAIVAAAPAMAHLAYATLKGGGTSAHTSAPFAGASLVGSSSDATRPVLLRTEHVRIESSAGLGLFLRYGSFDPASTDLTITSSGWYPAYMGVASANALPIGAYTGNAIDQILLQTVGPAIYDDSDALLSDVTLHDPGVPYVVGTIPSSIRVGDGVGGHPSASLMLGAGVTMLFTPQGPGGTSRILISAQNNGGTYAPQGALIVQGTAAAPVVLDSVGATPAAGDWEGIYFADLVDPRTSVDHAEIRNAGGASGTIGICGSTPAATNGAATCAVIISVGTPPTDFLQNTRIVDAPCGVYRGWKTSDIDFTATNTFSMVTGCTQSTIPASDGSCVACATAP
ncbi:MAG TPA: hypothetical protein VGI39_42195 [Polyangiaceae bacterium]